MYLQLNSTVSDQIIFNILLHLLLIVIGSPFTNHSGVPGSLSPLAGRVIQENRTFLPLGWVVEYIRSTHIGLAII